MDNEEVEEEYDVNDLVSISYGANNMGYSY